MPTSNIDQRTHTHFHCCIKQISSLNKFILPFQCSFYLKLFIPFSDFVGKKTKFIFYFRTHFSSSHNIYVEWICLYIVLVRRDEFREKWEDGRVEWASGLNLNIFPCSCLFIDMASSVFPRQFCVTVCSRMKSRFGKHRRQYFGIAKTMTDFTHDLNIEFLGFCSQV